MQETRKLLPDLKIIALKVEIRHGVREEETAETCSGFFLPCVSGKKISVFKTL